MAARTVLLVDDSRVARMMTKRLIEVNRPGWQVLEAASGEEALSLAATARPDFVVMDVNMPGMGGIEAARQLKEAQPDLAVTLLTANIQAPVRAQAESMGVGFLNKPVQDAELLAFLAEGAA